MTELKTIRILCVMSTLDRGGAESMVMNLYRHIDREKVQFDFVEHTQNKCAFDDEILALGGRIFRAPRLRPLNYFAYRKWWYEHFRNHPEHQIVHGHFFTTAGFYFKYAKENGRITVGHSHTAKESFIKTFMIKSVEKLSDYCLACGQEAGRLLYPNKDFIVLRNAVPSEKFTYSIAYSMKHRQLLGLGNKKVIGVVGSFTPPKNPLATIEIFKEIYSRDSNARLLWVGDGGMRDAIERKIDEYHLKEVVKLTGVRSDVFELLSAMDVYIMPSLGEGLPVALIEAQAAGLPCFCSDQIAREADITGMCNFLPLGNVEIWADAILAQDIGHRRDTSELIKKAGYNIQTTAAWLEDFYLGISKKLENQK